jgi:hypothetical protein
MKKTLFALVMLIVAFTATQATAQAYYRKQTSLYLEFFGNGGELSGNIEKLLGETISLRIGGGLTGVAFRQGFVVPFGGSLMFGGRQNKLELGFGGAWVDIDDNGTDRTYLDVTEDQWVANGIAGFRFLGDYGFTFRLAYQPAYTKDGLQHMGGAILGYSF